MISQSPEPILVRETFTDFDELTATAKAWNLKFNKLDAGPFHAELFQLISSALILSRGKFNGRLKQRGHPPLGFRTFTIPTYSNFWMYWRGRQVDGNNLMAFPLNGELDTISDPNFDIFTISIPEKTLFDMVEKLGFSGLEITLMNEEVLRCSPASMQCLRRCLHQCEAESHLEDPNAQSMKTRILIRLFDALGTAKGDPPGKRENLRRLHAIRKTDRFILEHPDEMPTIKDLCKLADVSERTFEYAFMEYYGMRPKAYINAMLLNGARRALRTSNHVADAANAWGFWHMGQFAKDYHKLFGELPSQTKDNKS